MPIVPCMPQTRLMHALWLRALAVVLMALSVGWARDAQAQEADLDVAFRQITPDEEARLKAILATPLDTRAHKSELEKQVNLQRMAAKRLSLPEQEEKVLREALAHLQNPGMRSDLAQIHRDRGEFARAVELHRELLPHTSAAQKPFFMAHVANDLLEWGKLDEAQQVLDEAQQAARAPDMTRLGPGGQRMVWRGIAFAARVKSLLAQRRGQWGASIDAALQSEQAARKAFEMEVPRDDELGRQHVAMDVGNALARRTQAYRAAGRLADAEQTLRDYSRFATEAALPQKFRSGLYITAANLRFAQREFALAEQLARQSDQILADLGNAPLSPARAARQRDVFVALAAQKKWAQALHELQRMDDLAQGSPELMQRIRFPFDRAYVYLGNGLNAQAADLFERVSQSNRIIYGEGHFFTAQAEGLQGVALWRTADSAALRARALTLLQQAVADLVSVRNADYLDAYGIRPDTRQLIVATCIEALALADPEGAGRALGLADWLRASVVQEALSDAAVRAAAHTQGLAELVRQEQDAKNEIRGIQSFLQAEAGAERAPTPEVAGAMRNRIAALDKQRAELQARIRAGFPGYERLVRPMPPGLEEIASRLTGREALWVFMPDATGVNVWAVKQTDGHAVARFHRAALPQDQLSRQVSALRASLESLGTEGRLKPFDDAAAHALHQSLIAPIQADMNDRPQWIVAASGALARLPLSVLQTQRTTAPAPPAWLIRQVSLSQVPSVGAWLSLRALPRPLQPRLALMAWGDPAFNPSAKRPSAAAVRNLSTRTAPVAQAFDSPLPDDARMYHGIPPLPETRDELLAMARALKADAQQDLLLGGRATRDSVLKASRSGQLAQRKVLAFATHGLMAGDLPRLSQPALALAADGTEHTSALAPLLTLEDVLGLELNADWVVLSACNTAAADGRAEEALSGLARGFFYAGSRSLLVTHWAVESESAKELTTRTFDHFTSHPQAPKADSLRDAMLQVMSNPRYTHPAYWAPYVLVGDAQR